jgi:hypothetical protein
MAYLFYGRRAQKKAGHRPAGYGIGSEVRSCPPDNAQYQRNQGEDNEDMNHAANTIYENAKKPSDQ